MLNRPIYKGKLEDLLHLIPQLEPNNEGDYFLFISEDWEKSLMPETPSAMVYLTNEEDNFVPQEVAGMVEILERAKAASIIKVAYKDRLKASSTEIIKAIENYISHDCFISFDDIE